MKLVFLSKKDVDSVLNHAEFLFHETKITFVGDYKKNILEGSYAAVIIGNVACMLNKDSSSYLANENSIYNIQDILGLAHERIKEND